MTDIEQKIEDEKLFDPKYRIKLVCLQRYVKSLGKKLMDRINKNGMFENAGQAEIRMAFDRMCKYRLDRDYQLRCDLRNNIRRYFNLIGNNGILDEDWEMTGYGVWHMIEELRENVVSYSLLIVFGLLLIIRYWLNFIF